MVSREISQLFRLSSLFSIFLVADTFPTLVEKYATVKFSTLSSSITLLRFNGTKYRIQIEPNHDLYHEKFKVHTTDGPIHIDRSEYIGNVIEPYSGRAVLSKYDENQFIGILRFHNDTLHLEPKHIYFPSAPEGEIVGYLSSNTNVSHLLDNVGHLPKISFPPLNPFLTFHRSKRDALFNATEPEKKNRCPMKIIADHTFYKFIGKRNPGIVTKYLVNMIARVNDIYTKVDFDEGRDEKSYIGRGRFINMGLSIKEIKILDRENKSYGHYNSREDMLPQELLEVFTRLEGSSDFCLVHYVTGRNGSTTQLGLAYGANERNLPGGICSPPYVRGSLSYPMNTLLTKVIAVNNRPMSTREVDIVVAHEIGHSWGSINHDPTTNSEDPDALRCAGSFAEGGNYIMNEYAQPGYDPNNSKFSPCSIRSMRKVLNAKWAQCFEEEKTSFCGNGVVEEGEECDNGPRKPGRCCDRFCRLTFGSLCSPLNHVCCNDQCHFHNSSHICVPGDDLLCKGNSYCTGVSADCSPSSPVEDGISCIEDGECHNGVCRPFCEKRSIGKKSCICSELELACNRCCRNDNGTCLPEPGASNLPDGTFCSQGLCRNNKCIHITVDNARRYFEALDEPRNFWEFLKSNIVFVTVFVVTLFWIPITWLITNHDRNNARDAPKLRHIPIRGVIKSIFSGRKA